MKTSDSDKETEYQKNREAEIKITDADSESERVYYECNSEDTVKEEESDYEPIPKLPSQAYENDVDAAESTDVVIIPDPFARAIASRIVANRPFPPTDDQELRFYAEKEKFRKQQSKDWKCGIM